MSKNQKSEKWGMYEEGKQYSSLVRNGKPVLTGIDAEFVEVIFDPDKKPQEDKIANFIVDFIFMDENDLPETIYVKFI